MQFVNDKLDKQVFQRAMSMTKPNDLGIHYGIDFNTVKGVNDFPVYSDNKSIHFSAHPSAEEFMYTKPVGSKYTVGRPAHHAPPSVDSLYDFSVGKEVSRSVSHDAHKGICNSLYGLPDVTLNFENFAAREAGVVGITDKQMMRNNWKRESLLPDGLEEIINRGGSRTEYDIEAGESKEESKGTNWEELEEGVTNGEPRGVYRVKSKARINTESKTESKSHSRVMAQPAFGFGSSTPKQESKDDRFSTTRMEAERDSTPKILRKILSKRSSTPRQESQKSSTPRDIVDFIPPASKEFELGKTAEEMEHRRQTARENIVRLQPTRDKEYRQLRLQGSDEKPGEEFSFVNPMNSEELRIGFEALMDEVNLIQTESISNTQLSDINIKIKQLGGIPIHRNTKKVGTIMKHMIDNMQDMRNAATKQEQRHLGEGTGIKRTSKKVNPDAIPEELVYAKGHQFSFKR